MPVLALGAVISKPEAAMACRPLSVGDGLVLTPVITANLTPRKCLGFKTPFQAILKELGKDVGFEMGAGPFD